MFGLHFYINRRCEYAQFYSGALEEDKCLYYVYIYIVIYIILYLFMCFSHVAVYTEAWPQNVHDIGEIDYRLC